MWKEKEWDESQENAKWCNQDAFGICRAEGNSTKNNSCIWKQLLARVIAVEGELRTAITV